MLCGRPVARHALLGDNVFPEGITEGGATVFYVGSMGDGTIYRLAARRAAPVKPLGRPAIRGCHLRAAVALRRVKGAFNYALRLLPGCGVRDD